MKVLFMSAGMDLPGGIASVDRSIRRSLTDVGSRVARPRFVSLWNERAFQTRAGKGPPRVPFSAKAVFLLRVIATALLFRPELAIFGHASLLRPFPRWFFPVLGRTVVVYVHGSELRSGSDPKTLATLRRCDLLLTNSDYNVARLRVLVSPLPPTRTLLPCIEPERFERWSRPCRRRVDSDTSQAVLVLGRMDASQRAHGMGKGHDLLLDVWPRMLSILPRARLILAGDGSDRCRLEKRVRNEGLEASVTFTGSVGIDEIADLASRSVIFALPSSNEGFGIVYAEAMLLGLPCIASSNSGAVHMVREGETGFLVDQDDREALLGAMIRLLSDAQLRNGMARKATQLARQEFSFERFRSDVAEFITELERVDA